MRCTQDHRQPFPLSPPAPPHRVVLTMITGEVLGPSTQIPRSAYRIHLRYRRTCRGFEDEGSGSARAASKTASKTTAGYLGGTSVILEPIQTPTLTRIARVLRHGCTLCLHGVFLQVRPGVRLGSRGPPVPRVDCRLLGTEKAPRTMILDLLKEAVHFEWQITTPRTYTWVQ